MRRIRQSREKFLFTEDATVLDVVEAQRRGLDKALNEVSATELRRRDIDDLVTELVNKFHLDVQFLTESTSSSFHRRKSMSMCPATTIDTSSLQGRTTSKEPD
jgi:hypothetical protein